MLLAVSQAFGAFERGGGLTPGPAAATLAVPGFPWTAFSNPGGLPSIQTRTLALSHTPGPFGLTDLAQSALAYVEPLSFGAAGLTVQRYGFELYREISVGLSAAVRLEDGWDAGISVNYFSLAIAGYGSAGAVGVDAGMVLELSDDVRAGFAALNLNAPTIGQARERLPQVFSIGLCYQPMEEVLLAADLVKDLGFPPDLLVGIEFAPVTMVRLLAGSGTDPSSFRAGVEVHYDPVGVGYAWSTHPDLGGTHHFSLVIAPGMF
jgi:hypothetical protein